MASQRLRDSELTAGLKQGEALWFGDFEDHFSASRLRAYDRVADEAARIARLIASSPRGLDSDTLAAILTNACAQAAQGAFTAVAAMLGVPEPAVRYAAADWYEQAGRPGEPSAPPVGFTGFQRRVSDENRELARRYGRARRAAPAGAQRDRRI